MTVSIPTKRPLTLREREDLLLLIAEAENRGMKLPKEVTELARDKKKIEWPIAPNGYFLRDDGHFYEPSFAQGGFIKSTARNVLFYGPRGSGKSGAGSQKALNKIKKGLSGVIMNPDFENLKISTWPEFKRWIPWRMVHPSQRHRKLDTWEPSKPFRMVFLNGAVVYIKGGREAGSTRGPNVNWFWYDEGGRDDVGLAWQLANASVRIGEDPQAWCTETPRPTEHWSYKFFIDQEIPENLKKEFEEATKGDRILIEWFHANREDNVKNLDATYYINLALTYPSGHLRAQEFDGEFANEGGKIGDRAWFNNRIIDSPFSPVIKKVRFWDLAATEKKVVGIGKKKELNDPDESVGTLASSFMREYEEDGKAKKDTNWQLEDQVHGFWDWDKLLEAIVSTARKDGPYVPIVLEEEPGSGGKNQVAAVKTHLKRFPDLLSHQVIGQRARDVGDRVMAANHWFALAAAGKMWMCKGAWNEKTLGQLDGFTQIVHDDRITSITGAITYIRPFKAWTRTPFITL